MLSHREGGKIDGRREEGEGRRGGRVRRGPRGREKGRRGRVGRGVQTAPITVQWACSKWTTTVRGM